MRNVTQATYHWTSPALRLPRAADGVVIGAGHNGLVIAAYLARMGLRVVVLEATNEVGGGMATRGITLPGFRHNLHAHFLRWTPNYRIWRDLHLERYGLRVMVPPIQNAVLMDAGQRVFINYSRLPESLRAMAMVSERDAESYEALHDRLEELVERVILPLRFSPPLPPDREEQLLGRSRLGRWLLEIQKRSALELIMDWFDSEPVRLLLAFNVSVRGYQSLLDLPGTGHMAATVVPGCHQTGLAIGGTQRMAEALSMAVVDHGGSVFTNSPVAEIEVSGERAIAVTTVDGQRVEAGRFVASTLPAPLTLLELVGARHLDDTLVCALREYRWSNEALFGVFMALRSRPVLPITKSEPVVAMAHNVAIGYENLDTLLAEVDAIRSHRIYEPSVGQASVPTAFDPSQAPPGYDTAFVWQFTPTRMADGSPWRWDVKTSRRHMDRIISDIDKNIPGLLNRILEANYHSPTDTEDLVPSMRFGDRQHGSFHPDTWGYDRPHPSLSQYRTPLHGLYLCGSSQHPGGGVHGASGFNAAGVIADDLGLPVWWDRPRLEKDLLELTDG